MNMFANQSYSPRLSYGHLLTERLTHGDFQGRAALALILESASRHALKKCESYSIRSVRPQEGLLKASSRWPCILRAKRIVH